MITASVAFKAAIAKEVTKLSRLWEVTRTDATVKRFADHDVDLEYLGESFLAAEGFTPSAIHTQARSRLQGVSIEFLLAAGGITEADIRARLYDGASCRLFVLDRASGDAVSVFAGQFGECSITDWGYARTEVSGLKRGGGAIITKIYQANCRADLGDADCAGVDIEALAVDIEVTATTSQQDLEDSSLLGLFADDEWSLGTVVWATGENAGFAMEVASSTAAGAVKLLAPVQYALQVGDTARLYPGCTKFPTMCRDRYSNFDNYQAEPFAPPTASGG